MPPDDSSSEGDGGDRTSSGRRLELDKDRL